MIVDTYPLSSMQKGMLFHTLLNQDAGVDVQQLVVEFSEPLRVPEFQQAWKRVIARHSMLRTDFRWAGLEQPLQQVHATVEVPWREEDWCGLACADRDQRFTDFLHADSLRGWDMGRAPLFRLAIVHFGDCESRFVWTVHHALLDGRSIATVMREVLVFYQALHRGEEVTLPVPRPYRDYIDWLETVDLDKAEVFWRKTLNGLSRGALLSDDVTTSATADETRRRGPQAVLASQVTAALRRLAGENECTLNTLIQGAWAVLLSRYCDQSDVVFGVVRACRSAIVGAQAMVGPFSNTLPFRTRVDPDIALLPWLRELHNQWTRMRSYEHTPLEKVRAWSDGVPGVPLFESIIMFENFQLDAALRQLGEPGSPRECTLLGESVYPINVLAYDGMELKLEIAPGRGRPSANILSSMLQHLRTLLEEIAANPERKIGALALITPLQREKLVRDWNNTNVAYPTDLCLHELFEKQVDQVPAAIAVICEDQRLTYRELNHRANRLAHHLRNAGIGPGDLVGIFMDRSVHLVVALLGVLKSGAAYVPIDPTYPADRSAFMLGDAKVGVVLCQRELSRSLPLLGVEVIFLNDPEWVTPTPVVANPLRTASDACLCYVMYTSGSTGPPKGVAVSHRAITNNILWMRSTFPMDARDRVLQKTEFSFDPSVWEFFLPLAVGAQLVIPRPGASQDPDDLMQLILERGITILNCIPSFLGALLDNPKFATCRTLRHCFCGGEVMSKELAKRFYAVQTAQLHNMYGPTEAAITSLFYSVPRCGFGERIPIGRPVANTQAYVLDRHRQPVPTGVPGELYLGGAQLAEGYHNRPHLTEERFVHAPAVGMENSLLFRTGDRVRRRSDGNIEFLGRFDQQVKFRGYRIELGEIEAALRGHAKVRNCAVVLHDHNTDRARLTAYVSARGRHPALVSELRVRLKRDLPAYMMPDRFLLLDALPIAPNGKVDRKALPQPGERERGGYRLPRTTLERELTAIWSNILSCEDIGTDDDFFELGGYSLAAVRLASAINQQLHVDIGVVDIFATPTIAQLAHAIEARPRKEKPLPTIAKLHEGTADPTIYVIGSPLFRLAQLVGGRHCIFGIEASLHGVLQAYQASPSAKFAQLIEPHLSALLAHMRSSRCVLVGYSFTGLMAFEIAHQLQKRGTKVELVVLLDTRARHLNAWQTHWIKWRHEWSNRVSALQFWQAFRNSAARRLAPRKPAAAADCDELPWSLAEKVAIRLQRSYRPQRLECRGVLFMAETDSLAALGWGQLFAGGVKIMPVPGDHVSMVKAEQNLQRLAREIRKILQSELQYTVSAER